MSDPWARLRAERTRQHTEPLDMTPRPASASRTEICTVMQITQANNDGNVHGGSIMRLVDEAAGIAAMRHARRRVVTASMDDMSFLAPVYIGDLVTVRAMVNDAHCTSMEVGVRVDVENIATEEWRYVASAHLVFVALDLDGRPPRCLQSPPPLRMKGGARSRPASAVSIASFASAPWPRRPKTSSGTARSLSPAWYVAAPGAADGDGSLRPPR